jgi:sigma-B regulation protein RsbU (phosphoserine phosphatase)
MAEASELLVGDIMVRNPVAVPPETTVADVAQLMGKHNIGAVIVASNGVVEGVFSERDLLRRAAGSREDWIRTPIARFMTPHPITVSPDEPWASAMAVMDTRRIRHLPVVHAGKLVGMLSVRDLLHHRAEYLEALVQDRTAALAARNETLTERDQQMTRNLKVAAKIQKRLLPHALPQFEPFRFAVTFLGHDQVTGDYHDFLPLGPDRLGVLIADASGHGVPAAFVSVMAKMCCNAYCQGIESPAAILATMNEHLGDLIEADHFITMFAAVLNRRTLELTYARAGHPLPMLYHAANRRVTLLDGPGAMIGVMADPDFADQHLRLEPGDKVLFFTDGVPECRNEENLELGTNRVQSLLERQGHLAAAELLRCLEQELARFRGTRSFDDDVTIIIVEATSPY